MERTQTRTVRILRGMLQGMHLECTHIVLQMIREGHAPFQDAEGGSARIDVDRGDAIAAMRRALSSPQLAGCVTHMTRLQSTHIGNMTLERYPNIGHWQDRSKERVHTNTLLKVSVLNGGDTCDHASIAALGLPLIWLEWERRRLSGDTFPCITQHEDQCHCIRREIRVGQHVKICFETGMNKTFRPVYMVWIEVTCGKDLDTLMHEVEQALSGLGVIEH